MLQKKRKAIEKGKTTSAWTASINNEIYSFHEPKVKEKLKHFVGFT